MGIKAISAGNIVSFSSKLEIIAPVKVAEIISNISHGIRALKVAKIPVLKYVLSDGKIAAIFSISSVASY